MGKPLENNVETERDTAASRGTAGPEHASDCAIYNAPALPVGPCDCGAEAQRAEIERLREERDGARRSLWLIVHSNGGYTLDRDYAEDYPGNDVAWIEIATDVSGNIIFRAFINQQETTVVGA